MKAKAILAYLIVLAVIGMFSLGIATARFNKIVVVEKAVAI